MKPETIAKIRELLENHRNVKEADMMCAIVHDYNSLNDKIAEYRAAYKAAEDFSEWASEQEDN